MTEKHNKWGNRYIDKYIRESNIKGTISYIVFINRHDMKVNERFETLEKARAYRDEALRLCEQKRLQNLKIDNNIKTYPENLIEALGLDLINVVENFEKNLKLAYRTMADRDCYVIDRVYRDNLTIVALAKELDRSSARVAQILHTAVRRLKQRSGIIMYGEYENYEEKAKREYLNLIEEYRKLAKEKVDYEEAKRIVEEYEGKLPDYSKTRLVTIEDLDLSVRSYNALKRAGLEYAYECIERGIEGLMRIRNLGRKSMKEVCKSIKEKMGVDVPEQPKEWSEVENNG